jgi:ribosomal protein L23
VEISAEPIQEGPGPIWRLLWGFGPALLLIGSYIWLYRRASEQGDVRFTDRGGFHLADGSNWAEAQPDLGFLYDVKVLEVRTANRKGKPRRTGYTRGKTRHWKKAVVVLHPEYHIDLF